MKSRMSSDGTLFRREARNSPYSTRSSSPDSDASSNNTRNEELPLVVNQTLDDRCEKKTMRRLRAPLLTGGILSLVFFSLIMSKSKPDYCRVAEKTRETLVWGAPRRVEGDEGAWTPEIPKIIHQEWKDADIPPLFQPWHQAWLDLYPEPEYKHMLWTDESIRNLIKEDYPFFLETFDSYDYDIKRADAARYFILHKHGGIYADMDYEPLVNFHSELPTDRVSLVESPYQYYESTQNSLMSSPKGDPFWKDVFQQLEVNKDMNVMTAAGPKMLDATLEWSQHPIHVLPCENFQRIPLGDSQRHVPFLAAIQKEVFSRIYPMKNCGDFNDPTCHFARHHCAASYMKDVGVWNLVFKG